MGAKRAVNMEALRILAMLMIVSMHYLHKGEALQPLSENLGMANLAAWLVEALCIGAANVYVLISGYFLAEGKWKLSKLLRLAAQVWLYSALVPLACLGLGVGTVAEWTPYDWLTALLPLSSEHYWFATAYVVMYLLTPALQLGVRGLSKKRLGLVIACLLAYFSFLKSVVPVKLPVDGYGYDFGWFICLFLMAAYIRLYGLPFLGKNRQRAVFLYAGAAAGIWLLGLVFDTLSARGLPLVGYAADMLYSYNHLCVLLLSLGLFGAFLPGGGACPPPSKGAACQKASLWGRAVLAVAPHTFGVYLLHENLALRYLWPGWFGVDKVRGSLLFLPHMAVTALAVFAAGALVDIGFGKVFGRLLRWMLSLPGHSGKGEKG